MSFIKKLFGIKPPVLVVNRNANVQMTDIKNAFGPDVKTIHVDGTSYDGPIRLLRS